MTNNSTVKKNINPLWKFCFRDQAKAGCFFILFFMLSIKTFSNDLRPANCQPNGGEFTVNSSIPISFDVCFDFDFQVFANEWSITVEVLKNNDVVYSQIVNGVNGNGPDNCISFSGIDLSTPFVPTASGTYTLKITVSYIFDINTSNDICTTTFTVTPQPPATIKGKKFNDKNGNGSLDSTEPGLPNWIIILSNDQSLLIESSLTDSAGNYSFTVEPGSYIVGEVQQTNWTQTFPQTGTYSLTPAENQIIENVNFGNRSDSVVIEGKKFNDENGNAALDSTESGLPNWIIILSNSESITLALDSAITDSAGNYSFTVLPGSYVVKEVQQDDWDQTFPTSLFGEHHLTVTAGNGFSGINFGNRPKSVTIKGKKFRDENGNGSFDAADFGLSGWTITLSNSESTILDSAITDSAGNYSFYISVEPGSYEVSEVQQAGWTQTFPQSGSYPINLTGGEFIENLDFGNRPNDGIIKGKKWLDINGNGKMDNDEPGISDWSISLIYATEELYTTTTDLDGNYSFTARPASYSVIEENLPHYLQTYPSDGFHDVILNPGQTIENINFGNKPVPPDSLKDISPEDGATGIPANPPPTLTWKNGEQPLDKKANSAQFNTPILPIASTTVTLEPVPPGAGKIFTEVFDGDTSSYTPPENLEYGTAYQWTVQQTNDYGTTENGPFTFTTEGAVSVENNLTPTEFRLYQNYPNPFNPSTSISYDVAAAVHVRLEVYNMIGQKITTLVDKMQPPGRYSEIFRTGELPSGIYIYRISLGNYFSAKKMILMK